MKTSSGKAKGRKLQQGVAKIMLEVAPSLQADDIISKPMGAPGEDLYLSPAARKIFPISLECKSIARFHGYSFMDQASSNCPEGAEPVVVVKANRRKPVVIVDANYFFNAIGTLNVRKDSP